MDKQKLIEKALRAEGPALDSLVEEIIFGRDLSACTPGRRRQAISIMLNRGSLSRPRADGSVEAMLAGTFGMVRVQSDGPIPPELSPNQEHWLWAQREGKTWQAALEKEVAEFRFEAGQAWSSNQSLCLKIVEQTSIVTSQPVKISLANKGWDCQVGHAPSASYFAAASAALAICRACLLGALECRKE